MFLLYTSGYQGKPWIGLALNKYTPWKEEKKSLLENANCLAQNEEIKNEGKWAMLLVRY